MSTTGTTAGGPAGSVQPVVRRLIVHTLLFALVVIAASGLAGLLGRAFGAGTVLAAGGVAGLARSLAFTLIGGPLAAVLWWVLWRRLDDDEERSSLAWGLYVAAMYVLSLVIFTTSLLGQAAALAGGQGQDWRRPTATGAVWAGVWVWHRWMLRHPRKSPRRLAGVPVVAGWTIGLVMGAAAAVSALSGLFDAAIRAGTDSASLGRPWWSGVLRSLVWMAGGAAIWWWHWFRAGGRRLGSGLAQAALVIAGILAAAILALSGAGVVLFVLLRLAFDRSGPLNLLLEPLGTAVAAALTGALVWTYHRGIAAGGPPAAGHAARLVTSGAALAAAASGIGVVVNSVLALAATPLAGTGPRTLLLGGISSLAVGGFAWWLAWAPLARTGPVEASSTGRRVYLVAVFGLSAVVALAALLVTGYRFFEFLLGDTAGGSLIGRVRVPLGLLVATGLAAGYHFGVWRHDRAVLAAAGQAPRRMIGRVVLVTGSDPGPLARTIGEATGASVTVWRRAGGGTPGPDPGQLARALEGLAAKRVLVVAGPGDRIEVVPLAD